MSRFLYTFVRCQTESCLLITLDSWWSLLTPVVCPIIKYVLRSNRRPKTCKADSQFEKLCRKTVALPVLSQIAQNMRPYGGLGAHRKFSTTLRVRLDGTTL